jgi:hypothetical protein
MPRLCPTPSRACNLCLGLLPTVTGPVGWCPACALLRFRTKKA